MDGLTIGEVARRAGLATSAIRYYERLGLLPAPERVSGQRRYEPDVLRWLAMIEVAQQAGFTLAETRTLLDGFSSEESPSAQWQALARSKLDEVDALITRAQSMRRLLEEGLRCECLRLTDHDELFSCCADWALERQTSPTTETRRRDSRLPA